MTTYKDDYPDRILRFGAGRTDNEGASQTTFGDATASFPRAEYHFQSSINKSNRGGEIHQLSVGGGTTGKDLDIGPPAGGQYGMVDIRETEAGHVLEFNDTPAGERILIKHATGSGVEFRPDGSVLVTTSRNKVEVIQGDNTVIAEGDVDFNYKGNLTINVQGDYELNCNNYVLNARGNKRRKSMVTRVKIYLVILELKCRVIILKLLLAVQQGLLWATKRLQQKVDSISQAKVIQRLRQAESSLKQHKQD